MRMTAFSKPTTLARRTVTELGRRDVVMSLELAGNPDIAH